MVRKPPQMKTLAVQTAFPMNMGTDTIDLVRRETAEMIAGTLRDEILEAMGPNWFETASGWIHQPGMYRLNVRLSVASELVTAY